MFPVIMIAEKRAFAIEAEIQRSPFQRKILECHGSLNDRGPVVIFTLDDVAVIIFRSADGREKESVNRAAQQIVIA